MKFGDAFTYVFQDQDWFKKLIIPGLVMLIPVIGQLVLMGWYLRVTKNVVRNDPTPLPELSFGEDLGMGFKAFVVSFLYSLPILIIMAPVMILSAIAGSNGDETMAMVVGISSVCFGLVGMIYGLVMALALPAALSRVAVEGSIGAGLAIGEVIAMVRKALVPYLLVLVGTIAAEFIGSLGSIACGVGVLLTLPYSFAIIGHLMGQAYMEAKDLATI